MRYMPDTLCDYNATQTFIMLGRSALSPQEFVERAKSYKLNYEQQAIVDKIKLKLWNASVKGERAG